MLLVCPGNYAARARKEAAQTLCRVYAGDLTLAVQIVGEDEVGQGMVSSSIEDVLSRIRIDPETGKGSVLDVIKVITNAANPRDQWSSIQTQFSHFVGKTDKIQFAGPGRPTDCADTPTLVEIAWLCPGKAAREFRRKGAITLCRALGGDLTLVDEIERRHAEICGTSVQQTLLQGTGITLADANHEAIKPYKRKRTEFELMSTSEQVRFNMETMEMTRMLLEKVDGLDDAAKGWIRDFVKNSMLQITDGSGSGGSLSSPVTWGVVMRAQHLGFRLLREHWAGLGRRAVRAYRQLYGGEPTCGKKPAVAGDTGCSVWQYTEAECEKCIDPTIRSFFREQ